MKTSQIYTKEQATELREKIINSDIIPIIELYFSKYPQLQSAMLLVAQYWDDEAADAVHSEIIISVLPTPVLGVKLVTNDNYDDCDPVNLPGLPSLYEIYDTLSKDFEKMASEEYCWEDNGDAVPLFAAYCKEGCHQDMDYLEAYTPYAIFRRKEGEIEIEVVGEMLRPWLDGMRPDLY
jgi:hypothetical protein